MTGAEIDNFKDLVAAAGGDENVQLVLTFLGACAQGRSKHEGYGNFLWLRSDNHAAVATMTNFLAERVFADGNSVAYDCSDLSKGKNNKLKIPESCQLAIFHGATTAQGEQLLANLKRRTSVLVFSTAPAPENAHELRGRPIDTVTHLTTDK